MFVQMWNSFPEESKTKQACIHKHNKRPFVNKNNDIKL